MEFYGINLDAVATEVAFLGSLTPSKRATDADEFDRYAAGSPGMTARLHGQAAFLRARHLADYAATMIKGAGEREGAFALLTVLLQEAADDWREEREHFETAVGMAEVIEAAVAHHVRRGYLDRRGLDDRFSYFARSARYCEEDGEETEARINDHFALAYAWTVGLHDKQFVAA